MRIRVSPSVSLEAVVDSESDSSLSDVSAVSVCVGGSFLGGGFVFDHPLGILGRISIRRGMRGGL